MSFERPTFRTILERVRADYRSDLQIKTILRRSVEHALTFAIAAVAHGLYGFLDFIFRMLFWDTAEGSYLRRHASTFEVEQGAAEGTELIILGTGDEGEIFDDLTEWQRSDGVVYIQQGDAEVPESVAGVEQVTEIETVADVLSSLNDTYFLYDTPLIPYYIWFNVDSAGTDPYITGRTGVEIAITEGDIADDVATALQTAINDLSDVSATVASNIVTATNSDTGLAEEAVDYTTGFTLTTTTEGVDEVIGGEVQITVVSEDVGAHTNLEVGDILSLVTPLENVDSEAEVLEITQEGEDIESEELFQSRFLFAVRNPIQGGAAGDYIQWMNALPGVTRSWVFPGWLGDGTVGCAFVDDNSDDIFPDEAEVDEVQGVIDLAAPATADVTVFSPTPVEVDISIKISPNTVAVRQAVYAELQDMFFREAEVAESWNESGTANDGSIPLSKIGEAISVATGEDRNELVSPATSPTCSPGEILILGEVTWQTLI